MNNLKKISLNNIEVRKIIKGSSNLLNEWTITKLLPSKFFLSRVNGSYIHKANILEISNRSFVSFIDSPIYGLAKWINLKVKVRLMKNSYSNEKHTAI